MLIVSQKTYISHNVSNAQRNQNPVMEILIRDRKVPAILRHIITYHMPVVPAVQLSAVVDRVTAYII